jgi:hypothetical protein
MSQRVSSPLDSGDDDPVWLEMAIRTFFVLGVVLRVIPYAMNFPIWGDESYLAVNIAGRSYRDLLRPLDYGQVCPPLFLWITRAIVDVFGFSERSLRLFPLVCALASLLVFVRLARLSLNGVPRLLAIALFAVSIHPIRHASDAKPYASDLLMSLCLLTPALAWVRKPERIASLWTLVALTPLTLLISYPAAFVAGAVWLGLIARVWRSGRWTTRAAFATFTISVLATSGLLYVFVARAQAAAVMPWMNMYWEKAFPPAGAWRFLRWLVLETTGSMLSYPDGGRDGGSVATFACVMIGVVILIRQRRASEVILLLAALPLTLAAAMMHRYPYGGEARTMQFIAPAVCLLMGLGLATLVRAISVEHMRIRTLKFAALGLAALGIFLVGSMLRHPYRLTYDLRARDFAREFWPTQARDAEVACVRWDFGVVEAIYRRGVLNPKTPIFLCNQLIYGPNRRDGGPHWERVSESHPLRCVLFHETAVNQPEVLDWLRTMSASYDLKRTSRIDVDCTDPGRPTRIEQIHLYDFIPKPGLALTEGRPPGLRVR